MKFKYFRDPDNFAYKIEEPSNCSICSNVGLWFNAEGFYGIDCIKCICDECLLKGKLKELNIETNEAFEGTIEERETIVYKTPALPTWQDRTWPFENGNYCVFERMASKADFENLEDFKNSFSDSDKNDSDLNWLWARLPEKRIANYIEGNFNVSVYLFTSNGKKFCTWDAS